MAGPTFAFLHLAATVPTIADLRAALNGMRLSVTGASSSELHLHGEHTGSLFVGIGPATDFTNISLAEREALEAALGEVPAHELFGYAMANQAADWEALRQIAERVAERFGGFVHRDTPPGRYDGMITVEHRDFEAFFGAMLDDTAYVRANAHLVPRVSSTFIPARHLARSVVIK